MFSDIKFERFDLFNQSDGLAGLKTKNKYIIEQFAPKEPIDENELRLKNLQSGKKAEDSEME